MATWANSFRCGINAEIVTFTLANISFVPSIDWVRKIVSTGAGRLEFIPPMLPTLMPKPPSGDGWIHEIKLDGYRCQIVINGPDDIRVYTSNEGSFGYQCDAARRPDGKGYDHSIIRPTLVDIVAYHQLAFEKRCDAPGRPQIPVCGW
ncbi:hypothetical protein NKJ17_33070, partial [Mesorhizobium sp. M0208]